MDRQDFMGLYESYLGVYEQDDFIEEDVEEIVEEEMPMTFGKWARVRNQATAAWEKAKEAAKSGNTKESRRQVDRYQAMMLPGTRRNQLKDKNERKQNLNASYEYDLYDLVLEYLLDEGLCESVENAEVMMAHMSEGWVDAIVESYELDEASRIMMITSPSGEIRSKRKHNGYTKSDGTFVMGRPLQDESPEEKEQRRKNEHKRDREWQRRLATLKAHDESPARLRRYARMENERETFEKQIHPETRLASREEHLANVRAKARARKGRG